MDRRRLVVAGVGLLLLATIGSSVDIVRYRADLAAGPEHTDATDSVRLGALPAECQRFGRSLAGGRNLSIEEYRMGVGTNAVLLRRTSETGRAIGDTGCAAPLWSTNHLQVGDRTYDVHGTFSRSNLHQQPPYRSLPALGGLFGAGMTLLAMRDLLRQQLE